MGKAIVDGKEYETITLKDGQEILLDEAYYKAVDVLAAMFRKYRREIEVLED